MGKKLLWTAAAAILVTACYNDAALVERLDKQDEAISSLQNDVKDINGKIDELQKAVTQVNSNIEGLNTIVQALQENDYVTGVTSVKDENGNVIGYTISFTKSDPITIYNGTDAVVPVIGVKLSGDTYYWTLDGKFITDDEGHPIPVTGKDGKDGSNGTNGKTPQLRINEGNWEIRFSDDEEWTVIGPAQTTAEGSGDNVFSAVKETKTEVIFTLADGSKLSIEKLVDFYINIDDTKSYEVVEGATLSIPYTLTGAGKDSRVDALASGEWWAEVSATDNESGNLLVTAGKNSNAKVIVYASDGKGKTDIRSIVFTSGVMQASVPATDVDAEGGAIKVPVVTNVDYTVAIADDAKSWISYAITKAGEVRNETLVLTADPNNTPEARTGTVSIKDANGSVLQTIEISQESGTWTEPEFEDPAFKAWLNGSPNYLDYNGDGTITSAEAARITSIDIPSSYYDYNVWDYVSLKFSSFKGIESLYNLKNFKFTEASGGTVTSLDLSSNSKLESVTIYKASYNTPTTLSEVDLHDLKVLKSIQMGNHSTIKSVKIGNATSLESISMYNTALEAIDVTGAPELKSIAVYGTAIKELDLSANTKIESVSAGATGLASIKFPVDPVITSLSIDNAPIENIDLSIFTKLTSFSAAGTIMETIDLSTAKNLTSFSVGSYGTGASNTLKVVDLRSSTKLTSVNLYSNALQKVILPKGLNTSSFNWTTYIWNKYEEMEYVQYEWIDVDEGSTELDDYAAGIKDSFVKKIVLNAFDTNGDDAIDETEAAVVKTLDFTECGLSDGDLTGLEVFPIEKLLLSGNKFTTFDGSAFASLKWVELDGNKLVSFKLPATLEHISAAHNSLTEQGIPSSATSSNLAYVDLSYNKLTSFSHQYNNNLKYVNVSNNSLTSFSCYLCSKVEEIDCSNNELSSVQGFHTNTSIVSINASYNKLSDTSNSNSAGISFNSDQTKLETINLAGNNFAKLDIAGVVGNGVLKKVDLSGNPSFALLIIGAGNKLSDDTEVIADGKYNVLDAVNPTKEITTDKYNYLGTVTGDGITALDDITINYSLKSSGWFVPSGKSLVITATANRKSLSFFAVGVGGAPTLTVARADGKKVYTTSDASRLSSNPATLNENASAAEDKTSFIVNGDEDHYVYDFGPTTGTSSGGLVEGDQVTLTIEGGEGAILFGVNIATYTEDDYGWM